jgi:hypothetical protein
MPTDEQRRLRWLAEDLAACLAGMSAIAARLSGKDGLPIPGRILVLPPGPQGRRTFGDESGSWEVGEDDRNYRPPIASVVWMWDDGLRVEYDWGAEVCRITGRESIAPEQHTV